MTSETRSIHGAELRILSGDRPVIVGYAATYGTLSADLGGFRERIVRGAFERSIAEKRDVVALVSHDRRDFLGRTKAGTLRLAEDERGLRVEIDVPDTTVGRDAVELVRRCDLDAMSFGFVAKRERWSREATGRVRELIDVDLLDVSLATSPAYPDTSVALRSMNHWTEQETVGGLELAVRVRERC